jgi:hypothetical protein
MITTPASNFEVQAYNLGTEAEYLSHFSKVKGLYPKIGHDPSLDIIPNSQYLPSDATHVIQLKIVVK